MLPPPPRAALDYILYTRNSLVPRGVLELPSEAEVSTRPNEGLPNANWPSDHISLMVEFQILPPK
jgi:CCR4-NOT transcription complex subunit 6